MPSVALTCCCWNACTRIGAQGLIILGMNVREETQRIQRYASAWGLTYPLVMDREGVMARAYGVIGLPTTFVVGRDGRPVALAVGPRAWGSAAAQALIQALLAESVGSGE